MRNWLRFGVKLSGLNYPTGSNNQQKVGLVVWLTEVNCYLKHRNLQTAMARQSAIRAGCGTKQKTRRAFLRSERPGFCFVGKKNLLLLFYPSYFRRMLAGIEDVDDIHILVCYLINEFVPPF